VSNAQSNFTVTCALETNARSEFTAARALEMNAQSRFTIARSMERAEWRPGAIDVSKTHSPSLRVNIAGAITHATK